MGDELEQLGERIAEQAAHLDAATHRLLTDLRTFDERGGWHVQGALSCAHWLSWRVGWTLGTARDHVRVARRLADVPTIDDALRRGEVSYAKVRAMVRIATPANELLLLEYARFMTGSQLEQTCRKYALVLRHGQDPHPLGDLQRRYVRRHDTEDGMVKIEAVLHPEEAELVWTMLNDAAKRLTRTPALTASDEHMVSHRSEPPCTPQAPQLESSSPDVSAETHAHCQAPAHSQAAAQSTASTAALPHIESASPDVSAETHAHCHAAAYSTASTTMASQLESSSPDVSAETAETTSERCLGAPASIGDRAADGGPAERLDSKSLLEQLLDEAELLRAAEAAPTMDVESAPSQPRSGGQASVLQQQASTARRAFCRADALVSLAQGYLRGERPNRAPIEVVLTIPASSLHADAVDPVEVGEIGESFVSREAARRLSCDSGVVEIVEDEHGAPLSVGRKRRTITGPLKRALVQRDKTCTFPGCTNHLFLEGHHLRHWADGGETSLANAALLCTLHHHYVHEYGYTIDLGPDQRPQFRDQHGRLVAAVPERAFIPDLGWPRIRAMNEPLAISAETIACKWDGMRVDYGSIVGYLVVADGVQ